MPRNSLIMGWFLPAPFLHEFRGPNKSHKGKSACINTRNPCRNRKQRIQGNENDGHMRIRGNHNHSNNHMWVKIMGTKEQQNENALGKVPTGQNLHFDKYVALMVWYYEDMPGAVNFIWFLTACSIQWGWWLPLFRFRPILWPRDLDFDLWPWKSIGIFSNRRCICVKIWWRYVNAFASYPWSPTRTNKQTVRPTYLPKCKFWHCILASNDTSRSNIQIQSIKTILKLPNQPPKGILLVETESHQLKWVVKKKKIMRWECWPKTNQALNKW